MWERVKEWAASARPVATAAKVAIDALAAWLKGQADRIPFDRRQGPGGPA